MAYNREQLMTALRNADAAGDTESATRIAQMIRSQTQQPQQERSLAQDALLGLSEAGGAMAQAVVSTANIVPMVEDAFNSADTWLAGKLGWGDGTYMPAPRFSLPEGVAPQTQAGQVAAEVLPFFASAPASAVSKAGKVVERVAPAAENLLQRGVDKAGQLMSESALGSAAHNSGNQNLEQATNDTLQDVAINAGIGGAAHGVGKGINAVRGWVSPRTPTAAITDSANEVSSLARRQTGRDRLAQQAAQVSEETARAAETAGVDIHRLTPGMTSESRGIAQAEGALASTPGITQDAHRVAFNEITEKFTRNLDALGAEAGTASEKSAAIKGRVLNNLDEMKKAEWAAWDNVRDMMPQQKMRLKNANGVIAGEKSAGVPLTSEMKQLDAANKQSGVTFEGMKAWRAKFADAEQKYIRNGEANAARRAGEVRRAITDDMRVMAEQGGFLDDWTRANALSKARLTALDHAESVFGRSLANDVLITKGVKALQTASEKGLNGESGFHTLISALPETERVPAIASMLQDALSHGVRGGKAEGTGIAHIASILTEQNVGAIGKYSKELGRIAEAYGQLARAAVKPQQYIERTGRTTEVLKTLDAGLPKIAQSVLSAVGNSATGAVLGAAGGGVIGGTFGAATAAVTGAVLHGAVEKMARTRSGRYAIEKAIQEATRAVKAGATPQAIAAAEKRFLANKIVVKAIREAVGHKEFPRLARMGMVATLSGLRQNEDDEF